MARGWIESRWHTDQLCLSGSGTKTGLICWMWLSNGTNGSMDRLLCGGQEDWEECLYKHSGGLVPLSVPAVVEIHWFGHGAEAKNQWCIQYFFVGFFFSSVLNATNTNCYFLVKLNGTSQGKWAKKKRFSPHMTCESTFYQTYSESSHVTERSISRSHVWFDGEKQRCVRLRLWWDDKWASEKRMTSGRQSRNDKILIDNT